MTWKHDTSNRFHVYKRDTIHEYNIISKIHFGTAEIIKYKKKLTIMTSIKKY